MSQPDFARALRSARPVAPAELRERVNLVVAQASPPPRTLFTWRRGFVAVVVVGAAVAAGVLLTRPSHHVPQTAAELPFQSSATQHGTATAQNRLGPMTSSIPPSPKRVQRYTASLTLRVPTTAALSIAARHAVAIAYALGGYPSHTSVQAAGRSGYADITLRIPKTHVQQAVRRLSALGRITNENVDVQDLTAGLNATDRKIASLQRTLAALRLQQQTTLVQRRILQVTSQIQKLQAGESSTRTQAHDATVELTLNTPPTPAPKHHHPGPLHGLGTAFRWIGIGLVYGLAIGVPFAVLAALIWLGVRRLRRRREDALLSQP
jgi:hypothetical protein